LQVADTFGGPVIALTQLTMIKLFAKTTALSKIFAVTLLFASPSYAADKVDFSSRFGPLREQGNTAWCHAAAAVDLLDEYFGHSVEDRISFFDLALAVSVESPEAQKYIKSKSLESGPTDQYRWLEKSTYLYAYIYPFAGEQVIYERVNYTVWDIFAYTNLNSLGQCKESGLPSEDAEQSLTFLIDEILTVLESPEIAEISFVEDRNKKAVNEIRSRCTERAPIQKVLPAYEVVMLWTPEKRMKRLVELIDQQIPVGVGFNLKAIEPRADLQHIGVVVGYEKKNGAVIFKIRNSYGRTCSQNGWDLPKCKDGYLYIDDASLGPYALEYVWIQR
jgi:hypothetical protein